MIKVKYSKTVEAQMENTRRLQQIKENVTEAQMEAVSDVWPHWEYEGLSEFEIYKRFGYKKAIAYGCTDAGIFGFK